MDERRAEHNAKADTEIAAIKTMHDALLPLTEDGRSRVASYVINLLNIRRSA